LSNLQVKIVTPEQPEWKQLVDFPDELYPAVARSVHRINDFIHIDAVKTGIAVLNNNKIVGRVVVYNSTSSGTMYIGNYEAHSEYRIAASLLHKAQEFAKQNGCNELIGPIHPISGSTFGLRQGSMNDFFTAEPLHQSYYSVQFEQCGFVPMWKRFATIDRYMRCDMPDVMAIENRFKAEGYTFQEMSGITCLSYTRQWYSLLQKGSNRVAFADHEKVFYEYMTLQEKLFSGAIGLLVSKDDIACGLMIGFADQFSRAERRFIIHTSLFDDTEGMKAVIENAGIRAALINGFDACITIQELIQGMHQPVYRGQKIREYAVMRKSLVITEPTRH
jgi:hypothetical protein